MAEGSAGTVVVLGTGGTIAGKAGDAADHIGYRAGQIGVEALLAAVTPQAGAAADVRWVTEQVAQIDSKDMDFAVWRALAARCAHWLAQDEVRAVVVTHGTDTLEETAYFLETLLAPDKPLVLTCAMRPATALMADGPQNLLDAVTVALDARAGGVLVVAAGAVHAARAVRKRHPYRLDAMDSGEAGPVAVVEAGQTRWFEKITRDPSARWSEDAIKKILSREGLPRVEIVLSHALADGRLVDGLVQGGVRGLVVAGTGNGTVHVALQAALERARAQGVRVVRASRCELGQVLPLPNDAFEPSEGLSPVKARIRLMLDLARAEG